MKLLYSLPLLFLLFACESSSSCGEWEGSYLLPISFQSINGMTCVESDTYTAVYNITFVISRVGDFYTVSIIGSPWRITEAPVSIGCISGAFRLEATGTYLMGTCGAYGRWTEVWEGSVVSSGTIYYHGVEYYCPYTSDDDCHYEETFNGVW